MCTNKIIRKINFREVPTVPLGWVIIPLISISDSPTKKSIMIPTEVLVDKHKSTLPY